MLTPLTILMLLAASFPGPAMSFHTPATPFATSAMSFTPMPAVPVPDATSMKRKPGRPKKNAANLATTTALSGGPATMGAGMFPMSAMMPSMTPGMVAGNALGMTAGIPFGMNAGVPFGMNVGMQPGMNVGMPPGMTVGMPPGTNVGVSSGVNVGMPPGMNIGMSPELAAIPTVGTAVPLTPTTAFSAIPATKSLTSSGTPLTPVASPLPALLSKDVESAVYGSESDLTDIEEDRALISSGPALDNNQLENENSSS